MGFFTHRRQRVSQHSNGITIFAGVATKANERSKVAIAVYKACLNVETAQEKLWLREILVIIYYGFTLASMALIGQIYQLDGTMAKLLLVWTISTNIRQDDNCVMLSYTK